MTHFQEINRQDLGLPMDFGGRVMEVLAEAEEKFMAEYADPSTDRLPPDPPTIIYQKAEAVADTFPGLSEAERKQLQLRAVEIVKNWWSEFCDRYYGID